MLSKNGLTEGWGGFVVGIGRRVTHGLRDGCIAFALLCVGGWYAADTASPEALAALALAWGIAGDGNGPLMQVALFGGFVLTSAQSAVLVSVGSVVVRSAVAGTRRVLAPSAVRRTGEAAHG